MSKISAGFIFLATLLLALKSFAEVPADAVWIDVRTPQEYAEGHLLQAKLIPFDGIEAGVSGLALAKNTPIYLYCRSGRRAEKAQHSLRVQGYTNVTNAGGLGEARDLASETER